jgi:hypothetical protein
MLNYQRVVSFSLTLNKVSKSLRVAGEVADIEVEVQDFMPQWKNLPKGSHMIKKGWRISMVYIEWFLLEIYRLSDL